jgi:hypothetical protein
MNSLTAAITFGMLGHSGLFITAPWLRILEPNTNVCSCFRTLLNHLDHHFTARAFGDLCACVSVIDGHTDRQQMILTAII